MGSRFLTRWVAVAIVIGIILRFAVGFVFTYNYDVYHWALTISNIEAGNGLYDVAGYYYTPVWGYLLALFSQTYGLLGLDYLGERFAELLFTEDATSIFPHTAFVTSIGFNLALTALIFVFDLVGGYLVYWIVREVFGDEEKARWCFVLWFLFAPVIIVGSGGGMFDSLSALMTLLIIALLIKGREFAAGLMFSAAILLKLFPIFLFFLFIAYIYVRHREDGWMRRVALAGAGSILMLAVLMVPQVLSGNVMDAFSFLLSRATTDDSMFGALEQYGSVIVYSLIIIAEIVLAYKFSRMEHPRPEMSLLWFSFIGLTLVFLYPSTPQYLLLLTPFLIIAAICIDPLLRYPVLILMVGTSVFDLSSNVMGLTSLTMYTDIISIDAWTSWYSALQSQAFGITASNWFSIIGGVLQYAAVASALLIVVKRYLSKKSESASRWAS